MLRETGPLCGLHGYLPTETQAYSAQAQSSRRTLKVSLACLIKMSKAGTTILTNTIVWPPTHTRGSIVCFKADQSQIISSKLSVILAPCQADLLCAHVQIDKSECPHVVAGCAAI